MWQLEASHEEAHNLDKGKRPCGAGAYCKATPKPGNPVYQQISAHPKHHCKKARGCPDMSVRIR